MTDMVRSLLVLMGRLDGDMGPPRRRPRTHRVRQLRPSVERLGERTLPAQGLTPVFPAAGSSLRAVVELQATFPDGQTVVGTGAMIDSFHVLTAAHQLYSAQDGGYATSVEAIPDANGSSTPFGVAFGTFERVDPSWLRFSPTGQGMTSPAVEDIGLVTLDRAIGRSTSWFALGTTSAAVAGVTFQTAGYPLPGNVGAQMYTESGRASGVSGYAMTFSQNSLTALPGQSGSPVWQPPARGLPAISGVLSGTDSLSSSGTVYVSRITAAVYNEVKLWQMIDKAPPLTSAATAAWQVTMRHPLIVGGAPITGKNVQALDFWSSIGQGYDQSNDYYYHIGEVNPYSGTNYYRYYNTNGTWTGSSYWSPYGSWSFTTPDWYQSMANDGYYQIGYTDPYSDWSYTNYYTNSGDYNGYSYYYGY